MTTPITTPSPSTNSVPSRLKSVSASVDRRWEYRVAIERGGCIRHELATCAADIVYWINQWCWTFAPKDPVGELTTLPFDLFPKQAECIRWLQERETTRTGGIVEKSRDMGATYLCCAYALHGWLFRSGYSVGFGSRKLEFVDTLGDPDSIFEKLRFLLYNFPAWMLPPGFQRTRNDKEACLINPANGSTITGEGGDNIGRGGRKACYFVDESAFIERPQLVERSLSQNTHVRIDVSTPNGPGNPFATKRFSGKVPVFTLHWRDDPRKGEDWYVEQKRKFDAVTVAQEIDIDYTASVEGICIPAAWVRAAVDLSPPLYTDMELLALPAIGGLDIGEEGPDESVLITRRGPVCEANISAWKGKLTTETAWIAVEKGAALGVTRMNYDSIGVGTGVKGTWQTSERVIPFEAVAVNVGEAPTENKWPDGRTSQEKFLNLRAEIWWTLRCRFERTYENVVLKRDPPWPRDECISIPNHPQLIAELSLPLVFYTDKGKIQLESKKDMAKRGVKSPNYGDALSLCYMEGKKRKEMTWW